MVNDLERRVKPLLAPLGTQQTGTEVVFRARLVTNDGGWCGYLAEGTEVGGRFVVRGWFIGVLDAWQTRPLEEILEAVEQDQITVDLDHDFVPRAYSAVREEALQQIA